MKPITLFPRPAGPSALVVTAEECLHQCRVDIDSEGATLLGYATAAQALVERDTLKPLTPRELVATAEGWPGIGRAGGWTIWTQLPVRVDAISYVDVDGLEQTLPPSIYAMRDELGLMRVFFKAGTALPPIEADSEIRISVTAGYPMGECAADLKQVVLALTERFNSMRSAEMDAPTQLFLDAVLMPHRCFALA